jgi:hypothetical protein
MVQFNFSVGSNEGGNEKTTTFKMHMKEGKMITFKMYYSPIRTQRHLS